MRRDVLLWGAALLAAVAGCGGRQVSEAPREVWVAAAEKVGPVAIGMSRAQAEAALGAPFETTSDASECIQTKSQATPEGVLFMQIDGRVVRVDVTHPGVATEAGVGVGDTEKQVAAAYQGRVSTSPHKYTDGHYLTIAADPSHRIVFETDGERVTRYRVGRLPEVEWVEGCS